MTEGGSDANESNPKDDRRESGKGNENHQDGDSDNSDKHQGKDQKQGEGDKPSPLSNPKVKIALIIVAAVVLLGGIAWFLYYWTHGRYEQSTNDAYLQADMVTIAPKVSGYVQQVFVQDNEEVRAGQPLVKIDERETQSRAEQSRGQVEQGIASIAQSEAQIRQQEAQIVMARAQLAGSRSTAHYAQQEVDRYEPLTAQGAHSVQELDQRRQSRDQALSQVAANEGQLLSAERQLGVMRAQVESARAQVRQAQAQARQAEVDRQSTLVRSSIAGRIGDRTVRVGQYVQPGTRMMSVVPTQSVYLVANFKETQIGLMRIGQPATLKVDAISGGEFHGSVQSFAPGTGAQFAILPPQNATGNFTKIVQRVPVRIGIEAGPEARKVLVPGLSVTVIVDTIGAKPEADRIKAEAKRNKERLKREHEQAVEANKHSQPNGPGQ